MPESGTSAHPLRARLYEGVDDLTGMRRLLVDGRAQTDDWRYPHVGDLMWSFFLIVCQLDPRRHVRLWHDDGGRLAGYAMLGVDPTFDFEVAPQYESRGVESEALTWAEELMTSLSAPAYERPASGLVTGARHDALARIAFLESHGMRRGEHVEVNLLRSLDDPIPPSDPAPGFDVRPLSCSSEEIVDRAAVERELWGQWPCGNIRGDDYARLMKMPGYDRDLDVVALAPDGTIAAYVNGWIDPVNRIGDLGPVGAREAFRRKGLTRAVLVECMRRMRAKGMDRVCVSTGEGNVAARNLYESVGFRIVNRYVEYANET